MGSAFALKAEQTETALGARPMIGRILDFFVHQHRAVVLIVKVACALGTWALIQLPIDAVQANARGRDAPLVFNGVPLALRLRGMPFSVSAAAERGSAGRDTGRAARGHARPSTIHHEEIRP